MRIPVYYVMSKYGHWKQNKDWSIAYALPKLYTDLKYASDLAARLEHRCGTPCWVANGTVDIQG